MTAIRCVAALLIICCLEFTTGSLLSPGYRRHGSFIAHLGYRVNSRPHRRLNAYVRDSDGGRQGDYESKLDDFYVRSRTLFLNGELDDRVSYRLISAILRINEDDPSKKIRFYINSPGGSVSAGLAIYDLLQSLDMPIETICIGQAASMGAFLLAAGTKGMRYAMPNSRIMIHQPLGGAHGQVSDIKIQANEILQIRQILNAHLSHFTGRSVEQIEKDCDRDNYMRPAEAVDYGLIDHICKTRTSDIVVGSISPIE